VIETGVVYVFSETQFNLYNLRELNFHQKKGSKMN
jgi:hypothetical protein